MTERALAERPRIVLRSYILRIIRSPGRRGLSMRRTVAGRAENAALVSPRIYIFAEVSIVPRSGCRIRSCIVAGKGRVYSSARRVTGRERGLLPGRRHLGTGNPLVEVAVAVRAPDRRALHCPAVTVGAIARMAIIAVLRYVGIEIRQHFGILDMELVEHVGE